MLATGEQPGALPDPGRAGSLDDLVTQLRRLNLDPSKPVMALLPGSRANELERLVPVIAAAAPRIAGAVPGVQFIVARAPNLSDRLFDRLIALAMRG